MSNHLFPQGIEDSPMYHTLFGRIESAAQSSMVGKLCLLAIHENAFSAVTGEVDEKIPVYDAEDIDLKILQGVLIVVDKAKYGIVGGRYVLEGDTLVRVDDGLVDAFTKF